MKQANSNYIFIFIYILFIKKYQVYCNGQVIGTYLTRLAISQPFNVAFSYVQFNQKLGYNMIIHTLIDQHSQIDDWLKTKLTKAVLN